MKKFILFSLGMTLSLYAGMSVSQALMTKTQDDLLEEMFSEAGVSSSSSNDHKELETLAGNEQLPFANLYLYMLQNIMHGPRDAAIQQVASITQYSEDEIEGIVLRGDTSAIIAMKKKRLEEAMDSATVADQQASSDAAASEFTAFKEDNDFNADIEAYLDWYYETYEAPDVAGGESAEEALTTDAIIKEYNYITDLYAEDLVFQQDTRQLAYEALAQEMFMNDKLDDSANIDLLYDLDLINYLLFGEYITYPDRSPDVDLASETLPDFQAELPPEDALVVLSSDVVDPYTCNEDEDLVAALDDYNSNPPDTTSALPEDESSTVDYSAFSGSSRTGTDTSSDEDSDSGDSGDSSDGSTSDSSTLEDTLNSIAAAFEGLDSFLTTAENLGSSDWTRSLPCDDVFCISVEFISDGSDPSSDSSGGAATYEETENCIACHLSYIQERLEETMSKSLVPSKISMNWFEDATCKEAGSFINLDLNVYAIKKPIDLDPGDELDDKPNKETDELKTKLFEVAGFPLPGGTKTTLGKTLGSMECESLLNLQDIANVSSSIDQRVSDCQTAIKANEEAIQEVFEEFKFDSYSQSTSDLFGQVSAELYTTLLYFETFQEGLKATYETDDAPLINLLSKGYCE